MGFRKQTQAVFINAEADLDTALPDGTQVFCKDTDKLWFLNDGAYVLISSGATTFNPEGWTVIVKSADQDITSATYQNDNDFSFSVDAGGFYMVECDFVFSNTAASTTLGRFAVDAGTLSGRGSCIQAATITTPFVNGAANTNNLTLTSSASPSLGYPEKSTIYYSFQASNSTTFRWAWGNSANTSRLWKGSILKYKKLN